jgi:hypothetical protein
MDSGKLCTAIVQEIGAALERRELQGIGLVAACDAAAYEAAFVGIPQATSASLDEVRCAPAHALFNPIPFISSRKCSRLARLGENVVFRTVLVG